MKLTFHGAARCVTGSKHLIELNSGTKILLDCGMFQGSTIDAETLNSRFGFKPESIDFLLLSHAHIDHCGLIPRLAKEGFRGKVYCTQATFDLTQVLLLDSAHIHEADVRYLNKKNRKKGLASIEPLYTVDDAYHSFSLFEMVEYEKPFTITDDVEVVFTNVGHIVGSAAINLRIREGNAEKRISFSGDVGRFNDEILISPQKFPQADYLVLESTYGDSLHDDAAKGEQRLAEIIEEVCLRKKGKVIIPAFSVGRTQEIVYVLNKLKVPQKMPGVKFYVDSPLSAQATEVVSSHVEMFNERLRGYMKVNPRPFEFKNLTYITEVEDSIKLNESYESCVIISASGMADAGRVKHHIKHNIRDSRNAIVIVGYCEPGSLGGKLAGGAKQVTIFHEEYEVLAQVEVITSMSAHGDYEDLLRFISCQDKGQVKTVFLVHGEYDVQSNFKLKLLQQNYAKVEIPEMHQQFLI